MKWEGIKFIKKETIISYQVFLKNNEISYYMTVSQCFSNLPDIEKVENMIANIIRYSEYNCEFSNTNFDDKEFVYKLIFNEENELNRYIMENS